MTLVKKIAYITPDEYLKGERGAEIRHEYVDGSIYSMAGESRRHNRIASRIFTKIADHLEDSDCETYFEGVNLQINARTYYYPDVLVTCETEKDDDKYIVRFPCLIVEVLSPSTASTDRREKLLAYKMIDSVQEYAIVWQDEKRVELHRRQDATNWLTFFFTQDTDEIEFDSINFQTNVAEIYRGISFD
jgi:Uma2 family endonuclease